MSNLAVVQLTGAEGIEHPMLEALQGPVLPASPPEEASELVSF